MPQYHFLIFEIMNLTIAFLAIINTIKNWKENKNRILIAISVYLAAVIFYGFFSITIYAFDFSLDALIVGYLTLGQILGHFLFIVQLEFMLYLKKRSRFYTLPFVIAFYIIVGKIMIESSLAFIIYATIVSYGSAYFLIKDGRSRRNGLAIGMGLFFLSWGLGQTFQVETVFIAFKLIGIIALYLGTRGFYEKYVFINVKEEKRIVNTWISKLVSSE